MADFEVSISKTLLKVFEVSISKTLSIRGKEWQTLKCQEVKHFLLEVRSDSKEWHLTDHFTSLTPIYMTDNFTTLTPIYD